MVALDACCVIYCRTITPKFEKEEKK